MGIEAGSSTYYQAKRRIIQDGLVLHLDAGVKESYSGGTTWRDISGYGHHFTLYNNPTFSLNDGGGFAFDGVNTYARTNSTAALTTLTPTISVICTNKNNTTSVFNKGRYASYWNYGIRMYSDGQRFYARNNLGDRLNPTLFTSIADGAVAIHSVVWDGTNYHFYRNNEYGGYSNSIYSPQATNGNGLLLGRAEHANGSFYEYYNGKIYAVYVYNRPLSSNEILTNYNATRHRFGV